MIKSKFLIGFSLLSACLLSSCGGSDIEERYRTNKRFWDADDYYNVLSRIHSIKDVNQWPSLTHPEKAIIMVKLLDEQNFRTVSEDEELGIAYRSDFCDGMFGQINNMERLYSRKDREDKYIFPIEFATALVYSLNLQIQYFDLGNKNILQNADNPNSKNTQSTLSDNKRAIVGNFSNYLDYVEDEKSFSDDALSIYVRGITGTFDLLLDMFPKAEYKEMKKKLRNMIPKAEDPELSAALEKVQAKILSFEKS